MDPRLVDAVKCNDRSSFTKLVTENAEMLKQKTRSTQNTVLHLASRFGHLELVKDIIKLYPEMVSAENIKLETPFHEASRQGHSNVVMVLLETVPWAASKLNYENQSALFLACSRGHADVLKLFINQPWLQGSEDEAFNLNFLVVASSRGHTDVVRELLNIYPEVAQKVDKNQSSSLHHACKNGHAEIARLLLQLDSDLALRLDNIGYMPLHLAAVNGKVSIFDEFLQLAPMSFQYPTRQGESIVHLTVQYNQFDSFLYLARGFYNVEIFHRLDQYGNTLLHLAISRGRSQMAEFLINRSKASINSVNNEGKTPLDILYQAESNEEFWVLETMLRKAGGKKIDEVLLPSSTSIRSNLFDLSNSSNEWKKGLEIELTNTSNQGNKSTVETSLPQVEDTIQNLPENTLEIETMPKKESRSPNNLRLQKCLSDKRRQELKRFHEDRKSKHRDIYREALQNARNTIIIVAVLIATVTFSAGINPPGGLYQEGLLKGKTITGKTMAFKIFMICNSIALFTSLCIVVVLVSIIPFRRRLLMRLLVITHKVMWLSLAFMATGYVGATWVVMQHGKGTTWFIEALLAVCAGIMGTVFLCLVVVLVKHWLRKLRWRRDRVGRKMKKSLSRTREQKKSHSWESDVEIGEKNETMVGEIDDEDEKQSDSTNSDVASSTSMGYHVY